MTIFEHIRSEWFHYGFETLAVVAGILIAFALDNWNEGRKEERQEQKILASLLQDFQGNLENLILEVQRPLIEKYISLTEFLTSEDTAFSMIRSKAAPSDYSGLLNDLQYQNVLVGRYFSTGELTQAAIELKQHTQSVLTLIKRNFVTR